MSLLKRLLLMMGGGIAVKTEPSPEDFEFEATYGLRYAGWEPEYQGTLSESTSIDTLLLNQGTWDAVKGTYGVRAT